MNTEAFKRTLNVAHEARANAKRRRQWNAELHELFHGGTLVIIGLFLATLYCLLNHRIPM